MSNPNARTAPLTLAAMGVVYGDIGTSPLYAFKECFHQAHGLHPGRAEVFGVLSLIFWSVTAVVTLKYVVFMMRADNRGEGGSLALLSLAMRTTRNTRFSAVILVLGIFAAALFYGDSMLTPAISVLSAVEGLEVAAPSLAPAVLPLTVLILTGLFLIQHKGTAGIGALFGPITLLWFGVLSVAVPPRWEPGSVRSCRYGSQCWPALACGTSVRCPRSCRRSTPGMWCFCSSSIC